MFFACVTCWVILTVVTAFLNLNLDYLAFLPHLATKILPSTHLIPTHTPTRLAFHLGYQSSQYSGGAAYRFLAHTSETRAVMR